MLAASPAVGGSVAPVAMTARLRLRLRLRLQLRLQMDNHGLRRPAFCTTHRTQCTFTESMNTSHSAGGGKRRQRCCRRSDVCSVSRSADVLLHTVCVSHTTSLHTSHRQRCIRHTYTYLQTHTHTHTNTLTAERGACRVRRSQCTAHAADTHSTAAHCRPTAGATDECTPGAHTVTHRL